MFSLKELETFTIEDGVQFLFVVMVNVDEADFSSTVELYL